ncbi:MAG: rRNA pseudouridine synthase [Clostridia bacterium]|nr:rRNA pseudouridine synthase [Clostridia bacterium]
MGEQIRLDKCLAMLGIGSRSEVKQIIRRGQVRINGIVLSDPNQKLDAENSEIEVAGIPYTYKFERTVMLNKPAGVLTAARDRKQRTVMDLLPAMYTAMGCMPAGRLDKDTTGLLILTSNGALAHRLIDPNKEVGKTYEAVIDGLMSDMDITAFEQGITVQDADGTFEAKPARVCVMESGEGKSLVRLRIAEGKYHQVKRMFAMCGHTVLTLKRVAIGRLLLDPSLEPGAYRELTEDEYPLLEQEDKW